MQGRHLNEPRDFTVEELEQLFVLAADMEAKPELYRDIAHGKLLASLFFEPSTRTRLSFEAAMLRIGGTTLGFADPSSSSSTKGESLADTVRTVAAYADAIVMRTPKEGAALLASRYSAVPIINAGDGGHHHPTQTLTDLLTIRQLRGGFEGLKIGFCGDLKFGRTVHSLVKGLSRYSDNRMIFISPQELRIPEYITRDILKKEGIPYQEEERLEEVIDKLDILYMTRVQRERFFNEEDYVRLKDSYILDAAKLETASKDLIILHPLPRVNEISSEIDSDPRAAYFKQARYGMFVRMALMMRLLGVDEKARMEA